MFASRRTIAEEEPIQSVYWRNRFIFSFLVELAVYTILITFYFFLVLHFLGSWLEGLGKESIKLYALVAITLIIGQAVLLEWVTTFLFRLLRGRSE